MQEDESTLCTGKGGANQAQQQLLRAQRSHLYWPFTGQEMRHELGTQPLLCPEGGEKLQFSDPHLGKSPPESRGAHLEAADTSQQLDVVTRLPSPSPPHQSPSQSPQKQGSPLTLICSRSCPHTDHPGPARALLSSPCALPSRGMSPCRGHVSACPAQQSPVLPGQGPCQAHDWN